VVETPHPFDGVQLSNELVRGLVDAAPDAIVVADETGQIVLVNRQAEALFGYERAELVGKPLEELVPERLRQVHRAHRTRYRAAPRTRPMGSGDVLFGRRRDGTEFPVEISLSPLQGPSGMLAVASVRDITDRVAAEAEQRRIRESLDATRDAIFIFDAESLQFTYVNQGAVEQVGYPRHELLQMTMLHLAPEFTDAGVRELLEPLQNGEVGSTMFTTVHRRRDGSDVPVEVILQAESSDDGTPRAFVMLVRDITERVEADALLHRASEELRLVEDRERIARDLHDKVIQRLFAAGMSLQAVSSIVSTYDTKASERVEGIVDELDETIRDIRSVIYGLQAQTTRRGGLRHEILRIVEDERPALGLDPRLRFDGLLDSVPDDVAEHLLAALRESLSNVARHAAADDVEVTISVADDVVLQVVDDGKGISDASDPGNGLKNLADRAAQLGGGFCVSAGDGGGTVLEWRVPNRA
jgi:PAS domain S-box-containing protein